MSVVPIEALLPQPGGRKWQRWNLPARLRSEHPCEQSAVGLPLFPVRKSFGEPEHAVMPKTGARPGPQQGTEGLALRRYIFQSVRHLAWLARADVAKPWSHDETSVSSGSRHPHRSVAERDMHKQNEPRPCGQPVILKPLSADYRPRRSGKVRYTVKVHPIRGHLAFDRSGIQG
jgi:hypothetical protein